MNASRRQISFSDWRGAVNERLHLVYAITIEDAGIDDEQLIMHWRSEEAPIAFVNWFGKKYDLTSRNEMKLVSLYPL